MGRLSVLRSDLPALLVPGRSGLAVFAQQVPDGRTPPGRRARAHLAPGGTLVPAGAHLQRPAAIPVPDADDRRLAADRDLLRHRCRDLPLLDGADPGDPGRRDPAWLLGLAHVRASARDPKGGRFCQGNEPCGLSRPPLSAGQDPPGLLRFWRQRGPAVDHPGNCHRAPGSTGRPVAEDEPLALGQGLRPDRRRSGLPGAGNALGTGLPRHQDPLDKLLRPHRRGLEPGSPGPLLRDHRRPARHSSIARRLVFEVQDVEVTSRFLP